MWCENRRRKRYLEWSKPNRDFYGEVLVFGLLDCLRYFGVPKVAEPSVQVNPERCECGIDSQSAEYVRADRVRGSDDINDLLSVDFWKGARSIRLRHRSCWGDDELGPIMGPYESALRLTKRGEQKGITRRWPAWTCQAGTRAEACRLERVREMSER